MTAGWISPRWVPSMVYVVVLVAGLYYAAMDLGGVAPAERVAGFVAAMIALLGVEAADPRWLVRPGHGPGLQPGPAPGHGSAPRPGPGHGPGHGPGSGHGPGPGPGPGPQPGPGRMVLGLSVRIGLFVAAAALDPSGDARLLFVLVPFGAYFAFGRTVSLALGGACLAVVVAGFALRAPRWYSQPTDVFDVLMFAIGLMLAIAMASIAVAGQAGRLRLEAVLGDLRDSHDQLTAYAVQVAGLSAAAERGRLARDIHDSLGHHLTAVTVQLEKAEAFRHLDAATADRAVEDARAAARQALREVRGSVAALRGDELRAQLSVMIAGLVQQAGPGEPQVTVSVTGDEAGLGATACTVLFRAAQEALTNVRRHGAARRVCVSVTVDDREARLVVADDGRGFDPASRAATGGLPAREGFGLLGMRERAALAGGHAEINSRPGAGTTVTVTVPVQAAPIAPVVPAAPAAPIVPAAPVAPIAPVAPAAPVAPVVPAAPVAPVAPVPAAPAHLPATAGRVRA